MISTERCHDENLTKSSQVLFWEPNVRNERYQVKKLLRDEKVKSVRVSEWESERERESEKVKWVKIEASQTREKVVMQK